MKNENSVIIVLNIKKWVPRNIWINFFITQASRKWLKIKKQKGKRLEILILHLHDKNIYKLSKKVNNKVEKIECNLYNLGRGNILNIWPSKNWQENRLRDTNDSQEEKCK